MIEETPELSEDEAWGEFWDARHALHERPDDDDAGERADLARANLKAAIVAEARRPLEERIAYLRRLLRDLLAAGEVDGRNALIARVEATEAANRRLLDALREIRHELDYGGDIGHTHALAVIERALASGGGG